MRLDTDRAAAINRAEELFGAIKVIEPTADELALAAALEYEAQKAIVSLDTGESQLVAVTIKRPIDFLVTGDKRAILALEQLLGAVDVLTAIEGRAVCLEQLVARLLLVLNPPAVRAGVCSEPSVDTAMTICFSCGRDGTSPPDWHQGLASYVKALRQEAPRILAKCDS
ncbi:MAG: hypothetical protein J0I19_16145 [Alphaproteobacteria bacterium]|nr:hypothetical protein [Alphaproteobacteria bacterium]